MHSFVERKTKLENLLKNANTIKNMLDIAYEIIGNPILMIDLTYKLLAITENKVTDDVIWNEMASNGFFSHKTVDFFNTENFIAAYAKCDVSLMTSKRLKYERATGIIYDQKGDQLGSICVLACYKPFEEGDFELINIVCEYLAIGLERSGYKKTLSEIYMETLISELIEGKNCKNDLQTKHMKSLYKDFKKNLRVGVIDIIQYENTLTHLVYFRDLFKKLQSEIKYFIYLNNIVMIFSTDSHSVNIKRDLGTLNDFFTEYKIYAGVSREFQNLYELKKYFKQALNALNYGLNTNSPENIFFHEDFYLETFLSAHDNLDITELCHPIIISMNEYDNTHKTNYIEILYSYFVYGMKTQTAHKRMKMSHEEYCGKMEEISKIFGIDLENGNMLLSLFRTIKLLKCFPEKLSSIAAKPL